MRIETGARGRAAEGDLTHPGKRAAHAIGPQPDLRRVAAELLPERDRNRVHQVRPASFDDVGELLGLALERRAELVHRGEQIAGHLLQRREMHGRGKDVVRGLAHVDVVVGMGVVAGQVGHDLVGVHVRRRPGAGLEDVDGKLVVVLAGRDRVAGSRDPLGDILVEQAELGVHPRRGGLDPSHPVHDGRRNRLTGDGEVLYSLGRLGPPELALNIGRRHRSSVIGVPPGLSGGFTGSVSLPERALEGRAERSAARVVSGRGIDAADEIRLARHVGRSLVDGAVQVPQSEGFRAAWVAPRLRVQERRRLDGRLAHIGALGAREAAADRRLPVEAHRARRGVKGLQPPANRLETCFRSGRGALRSAAGEQNSDHCTDRHGRALHASHARCAARVETPAARAFKPRLAESGAMSYRPVDPKQSFPELEDRVLQRWRDRDVFHRSVAQREGAEVWSFYEGPPTANGRPGSHHVLSRVFKDIYPRFRTMRGYRVPRKAGWDCHGLPVELEVEKKLGISSKQEIEEHGIDKFNAECRKSVFEYVEEWNRLTERIGFWMDLDDPYVTLDDDYIESVWWSLRRLWDEERLYEGHKVVPYCPRCGTALSSHEVAVGYRDVEDPSIYVRFPLLDDSGGETGESLLIWTTTPWTLPGNVAVAAAPEVTYVRARLGEETLILAEALMEKVLGEE